VASRARVEAKFLYVGDQKFYVKGATYGAFAPNSRGDQFPESADAARDFRLMRAAGINTILTYTIPPIDLLDLAWDHGIRVIPNIPWMAYECFLEEARFRKRVIAEVRAAITACQQHPAVLMYAVAKELPPQIVRWHGAKKIEAFLRDLCDVAHDVDPGGLVTYTNFPTTEYLELPFVDVSTFNVYLHERPAFCKYLSRLQHLAGEKPLVMTEFGQCSFRHGRHEQARFLDWQIEEIFDHGCAGAVIFGWTDPFFQDGNLIDEWGFGLVDADRNPKPSYDVVRRRFTTGVPFAPERRWPKVSVVVGLYNAERTLRDCLESLGGINYPDYEVIVVNDGSTDGSEAIMRQFPYICVTTPNQGISAARNEGLRLASGEIVAYIDSDANADPEWLSNLAATYLESDVVGVGGPNIVPAEDNWEAQCVYRAPGGPTQVMLDDQRAEHIPGCNMSFRRAALEEIGGFDPIFRKAADDVDICWRLLDRGYSLGFSPSAVVWHHRRPSVRAYWKQQVGYGESEAILERKFPNKFNPWGHTFWGGRIYAPYPFFKFFRSQVVYQGLWGSAPFQPMYDQGSGNVLAFLPRAMEWHFALAALLVLGLFQPLALAAVGIGAAYTVFYCAACAWWADISNLERTAGPSTLLKRFRWRLFIAYLNFLEPIARDWGRLKGGLTPWRTAVIGVGHGIATASTWMSLQPFYRHVRWARRGGPSLDKFPFLDRLSNQLIARGCAVGWNPSSEPWDLRVRRGALGDLLFTMVVEHHGGLRRQARFAATVRPPKTVQWVLGVIAVLAALAALEGLTATVVLLLAALLVMWVAPIIEGSRLEIALRTASEEVAAALEAESAQPVAVAIAVESAEPEMTAASVAMA
jgi:GT2 family glycosyltransferase